MADASVSSLPFLPLERRTAAAIPSLPHASARANQASGGLQAKKKAADSRQLTPATCNGGRETRDGNTWSGFQGFLVVAMCKWRDRRCAPTSGHATVARVNSAKATDDALLPPSTRGADTPPAGGMDDDINSTNVVCIDRRLRSPGILFPGSFAAR
jgi:hypothetical protein